MSSLKQTRIKFISSITDWFLVISSLVLFIVEVFALLGFVPFITHEMVEISVFQIWVPFVLGSLGGHLFPLPWRREATWTYVVLMLLSVGIYVLWYIYAPETHVISVLDILAEHLYAFFLSGYVLGSTFFGRPRHSLED